MTDAEAKDFLARLNALGELFNAKLSDASQIMYFEALRDIDLHPLVTAIAKAAQSCKFMPKPVELRELAIGDINEMAFDAWNGWRKAAAVGGRTRSIICDGSTAYAIETTFGSWPDACSLELSPEMWASKRKEFASNFRTAELRQPYSAQRLLRGTGTIDDRWNAVLMIDIGGAVIQRTTAEAREELSGGPDAGIFNRLLPS